MFGFFNNTQKKSSFLLLLATFACTITCLPVFAEYTTPGFGSQYSLDQLVAQSGGAVTGGNDQYVFHDSVVISQGDQLNISAGQVLEFQSMAIGLEIHGSLVATGTEANPIALTGTNLVPGSWRGLDFNDTIANSIFELAHVEIAYADIAIDVFEGDVLLENCEIHHSLDKAVDISSANGVFRNCHLHHNQQRTVSMTLSSSPLFENCILEYNNRENSSPYPYFNVGLQGTNSPTIRGCQITGNGSEMSGGMAFWASCVALVENNNISGCGYGILCYSTGANPIIHNNTISENTIHPDTVNWGFGVACNGNNAPILTENEISGHGYGVALINGAHPNLGNVNNGSTEDDGFNYFHDNGLDGNLYDLFNNTSLDIMAQANVWGHSRTLAEVEDRVQHQVDDPSLGFVTFEPALLFTAATDQNLPGILTDVSAYPNPFNPRVEIKLSLEKQADVSLFILDARGQRVALLHHGPMNPGAQPLVWNGTNNQGKAMASGVYFYRAVVNSKESSSRVGKLVLVR
ncbi:MAG: DUF1565 domain-containing protein [bacterium]|nr:DUF1565 domain-containing protein [bacterium]